MVGTMDLTERVQQIDSSRTAALLNRVEHLEREGRTVFNLGIGEPGFPPADEVIAATQAALAEGHTRYTDIAGLPELREQLAARFPGCSLDQVLVTNGSKQALYSIFQSICQKPPVAAEAF